MSLSFTEWFYVSEDKKYLFLVENELNLQASNKGSQLSHSINSPVNLLTEGAEIQDFASIFTEEKSTVGSF